MYKLPMNDAEWILKYKTGIKGADPQPMNDAVMDGIRLFVKEHRNDCDHLPRLNGSLAKRITRHLQKYYTRMLADKYMMDWLGQNRPDLNLVKGELRHGILELMKAEDKRKKKEVKLAKRNAVRKGITRYT